MRRLGLVCGLLRFSTVYAEVCLSVTAKSLGVYLHSAVCWSVC